MERLAIVSTHPIQYNAPFFKLLSERGSMKVKVFYTWEQSAQGEKYDPDFGKVIKWDIPLLEGYEYTFVENTSKTPGSHSYKGIVNPTLIKEIEEWRPDALLVFGWSFHSHFRCLRHFHKKVPVLFRGDSTLLNERPGLRQLLRRIFLRWVYRHVDLALYVGTNNKAYFRAHGLKEEQLVLAPHAIDNARFAGPDDEYSAQARRWRQDLGIGEEDLVLLYAGKIEPVKNPLFVVELARAVGDSRLKIIFVGSGLLEKEVRQAAASDGRFRFLDFQNQRMMPVVYRLGDIFILPSVSETWGLGANEAMASGCALILSDKVGGAVDLVRERQNGIIVSGGELNKAAGLIRALLNDRRELARMKTTSRETIKDFSYEKIVLAVEQGVLRTRKK